MQNILARTRDLHKANLLRYRVFHLHIVPNPLFSVRLHSKLFHVSVTVEQFYFFETKVVNILLPSYFTCSGKDIIRWKALCDKRLNCRQLGILMKSPPSECNTFYTTLKFHFIQQFQITVSVKGLGDLELNSCHRSYLGLILYSLVT